MFESKLFARRVRQTRYEVGLTQLELAMRAGLSLRAVNDIELNKNHASNPTVRTVMALAKVLKVNPAWLCGW